MGKRRRASISGRGGVTAVSLKDAVRSAEAVLNDTAAGGSGGSSVGGSVGVLLGAAAGGGKKKTKRKGKKGGKHANTMLIRAHHTVNQQLATAREEGDLVRVKELETIVGTLGGFDMYQTASIRGEELRNHNTSRWLVSRLDKPLHAAGAAEKGMLQLLDVGALSENYVKERSWLKVTGIDLNSQCSFVQQVDFFEYEPEHDSFFDVVSLSLVLNFVGEPKKRGEMIMKSCRHLKDGGLLFIVLPRACVDNSRYMTIETLLSVAAVAGLEFVEKHTSARLAYFLFKVDGSGAGNAEGKSSATRKGDDLGVGPAGSGGGRGTAAAAEKGRAAAAPEKRKIVRTGAGRNNFAILM